MTVIIDDKEKKPKIPIPYREYNNPDITLRDIEICCIRQIPLPKIVNAIYKPNPDGDTWFCRNCKTRGDKWYLMIHLCKGSLKVKEIPKTELEIQQAEEEIQRRLEASKWTCPYCNEVTDRFYSKFHYRCLPEDVREQLDKRESKTEICPDCKEVINSYYSNFHYPKCKAHPVQYSQSNKAKSVQVQPDYLQDPLEEFRDTPTFKRAQLFLYDLRKKQEERRELISAQFRLRSGDKNFRARTIPRHTNDLFEYLRNKAVLENGWWVLYRDGIRFGLIEKATPEELTNWDPNPNAEKNEGSDQ